MGRITLHTGPQTNKRSRMATSTVQRCVLATLTIALLSSTTMAAAVASASSWFREKYNEQTYHDYYDYTVSRSSLIDNNRDTCPDFHASASIFAITGQQIQRVTRTCSSLYVNKGTTSAKAKANGKYNPPEAHYTQMADIIVVDVVEFIGVFMCYLLEFAMLLVSLILLFWSTLIMVMLLFCQY